MKLDNQDLLAEFYEKEKDNYPDLSFEQFKEVCFGPWRFLKDVMESGTLETIRFKYFGIFTVFPGRVEHMKKMTEVHYSRGTITEEDKERYLGMLENFKE